jgi:hypothetical protein
MTDASAVRDDLLLTAAREYKGLHEALHGLNEEQTAEVWLGSWSIREIVAHIAGWHREMLPALQRIARGERPLPDGVRYDDVDAWNARFAAGARDRAIADLLLDLDRSHEDLMQAAARVPAERFERGKTAYRIVDQISAHHYREHADQVRAWRASRGV